MAGRALLALAGAAGPALALDNGLGRTPPMGWRSWNLYGSHVDQRLMERVMDGMASRKRKVGGVPTSLCDLGYCDVGLDDNWQACGKGSNLYRYHAAASDGSYHPVVDLQRFPDLAAMTAHAHALNLTAGWYGNNCICRELWWASEAVYRGDVKALVDYGFDGIKLDGCGSQYKLDLWSDLINQSGRPVTIENCHWGRTVPTASWCPWNTFRTSGDVRASYGSVVGNLLTTVRWARAGLSRPGCWAYPDMLEVGCQHGPGGAGDPGLTLAEARSHFGAWCIVSSPLILSHDVNNDTIMDELWPIISNREAIAVNQAWAGHSGSPFKQSTETVQLEDYNMLLEGVLTPHEGAGAVPSWQYFYKPLGASRVAVLLMNHGSSRQTLQLDFADVPGAAGNAFLVRDVWEGRQHRGMERGFSVVVDAHDSAFYVLEPLEPSSEAAVVI